MLLLMLGLFSLPILIVVGMYYVEWRPDGQSHGTLISPPVALHLETLPTFSGANLESAQWRQRWNLVHIARGGCDTRCEEEVHTLRQVHVSLNKEIDRLQRILVVPGPAANDTLARLQQRYPDQIIIVGKDADALAAQIESATESGDQTGTVSLVDPLGNVMMHYPEPYDPKGLRQDLTRLLKYSWVG